MLSLARSAGRVSARLSSRPQVAARHLAVKVLTDDSEFGTVTSSESLSVVYFTAAWCGPCKMISPIYDAVSDEYPSVSFLKVDVDDQPDVAAMAQVQAMPTFQFFKSGKMLDKIVGADPDVSCSIRPPSIAGPSLIST